MSTPISWSDLRNRSVVVWGIGVEGTANLRQLNQLRVIPRAVVDRQPGRLSDGTVVLAADSEVALEALHGSEVVIKSPGISRYQPLVQDLVASGVQVVGGMGLWLAEASRDRVLCVTGTKGKSTTTAIAGSLLRGLGLRCFVGGNLGTPPWDPAAEGEFDYWVVEVSSYQALDVTVGPAVVAVTSLSQDHLTWHANEVDRYYADKLSLCTRPGVGSVIANGADPLLRQHSELLGPTVTWVDDMPGEWANELRLLGAHNLRNAAVAQHALLALGVHGARDESSLALAASTYEPLPSRLTLVGTVDGVDFVDDSLSTNVLPTLAALAAFRHRRVALIVGGYERGIDYTPLAEGLSGRRDEVVLLAVPDNGPRIAAAVSGFTNPPEVLEFSDIAAATAYGYSWAQPDGVVLLSPAAPSFGRYADYHARALAFAAAMSSVE